MGFWLYMLVITLLIPLTLWVFGRKFRRSAPKTIQWAYGYRTGRSMKNRETWIFAHQCLGRIWQPMGLVLAGLSVGAMLLCWGAEILRVSMFGLAVVGVQLLLMLLSICQVERALKREFDDFGQRRDKKCENPGAGR